MGGAVIMIILLVVVMPVAILLSGALAAALIGGLSISTLFTLFLVPVLISLLIDMGFHTRKEDLVKDSLQTPLTTASK